MSSSNSEQVAFAYHDLLPTMLEKLGSTQFLEELSKGFALLMDPATSTITPQTLLKNAPLLGIEGMNKDDIQAMVAEGDMDGDGAVNENEFNILMLRLSPAIKDTAHQWLIHGLS